MTISSPDVTVLKTDHKRCTRCGIEQPRSEFWENHSAKDGLQFWCKTCFRTYDGSPKDPFVPYEGDTHKRCGGQLIPHSASREGVVMRCSSCRMAGIPV